MSRRKVCLVWSEGHGCDGRSVWQAGPYVIIRDAPGRYTYGLIGEGFVVSLVGNSTYLPAESTLDKAKRRCRTHAERTAT